LNSASADRPSGSSPSSVCGTLSPGVGYSVNLKDIQVDSLGYFIPCSASFVASSATGLCSTGIVKKSTDGTLSITTFYNALSSLSKSSRPALALSVNTVTVTPLDSCLVTAKPYDPTVCIQSLSSAWQLSSSQKTSLCTGPQRDNPAQCYLDASSAMIGTSSTVSFCLTAVSPVQGQCYTSVYKATMLGSSSTVSFCTGVATVFPAECAVGMSKQTMLGKDDTMAFCKNVVNSSALDCYLSVNKGTMWSRSDILQVCTGATTGARAECVLKLNKGFTSKDKIKQTCLGGK